MPKKLPYLLLALGLATYCSLAAFAQTMSPEEITRSMKQRFDSLEAKLKETESTIATGKELFKDGRAEPAAIKARATKDADALIARINSVANELKAGGDINTSLVKIRDHMQQQVTQHLADSDPSIRGLAKKYEGWHLAFANLEKQRDVLLQDLTAQVRQLEANKRRIVLFIEANEYDEIAKVVQNIFKNAGELVGEAKSFNKELEKQSERPVP